MASYHLIDSYLERLSGRLHWRANADEVIDELRDHLYSAMDEVGGASGDDTAQQRILDRFGEPEVVAAALATTSRAGIAVPTRSTNGVGLLAMVTAGLWLVMPLCLLISLWWDDAQGGWDTVSQLTWMVGTFSLVAAATLTVAVMVGLRERLGGLGLLATTGMVCMSLGALAGVAAWLPLIWASLVAFGAALFVAAMVSVDVAPRLPTALLGSAWIIGIATGTTLRAIEFGPVDEWGEYWHANTVGLGVGAALFAAGLGLLGRWLHGEEPTELEPAEPLVHA